MTAIAATINEESQTLVDVVEPFLLKIGFVIRTSAGRRATPQGMAHVGAAEDGSSSGDERQSAFNL